MRHVNNEKLETTPEERNGTTKSRKNSNARWKGILLILGDTGNWHHQTSGDERKN